MALASLRDIVDELASVVSGVLDDQTDYPIEVRPRRAVSVTSTPIVDIYPGDSPRFTDSAGYRLLTDQGGYQLTIRTRISGDVDAQQDLLLEFMDDASPLSLAAAVTDDPTLNGLASGVSAQDPTGHVLYEEGDAGALLGFQFTCVVLPAES